MTNKVINNFTNLNESKKLDPNATAFYNAMLTDKEQAKVLNQLVKTPENEFVKWKDGFNIAFIKSASYTKYNTTQHETIAFNSLKAIKGVKRISCRHIGEKLEFWVFSDTFDPEILDATSDVVEQHWDSTKELISIGYLAFEQIQETSILPTFDWTKDVNN